MAFEYLELPVWSLWQAAQWNSRVTRMAALQKLREKAGLTQAELARRLGVSEITVRKWESESRTPRVYRIRQLARVLKCAVGDLL